MSGETLLIPDPSEYQDVESGFDFKTFFNYDRGRRDMRKEMEEKMKRTLSLGSVAIICLVVGAILGFYTFKNSLIKEYHRDGQLMAVCCKYKNNWYHLCRRVEFAPIAVQEKPVVQPTIPSGQIQDSEPSSE